MWNAFKYMMKLRKLRKIEKDLRKQTEIRTKAKSLSLVLQAKYEKTKMELDKLKVI